MKLMSKISVVWVFLIVAIIVVPLTSSSYIIGVMCFVAVFGALGIGMGVLMEQAGIFSLAHPTWFGLGAYISGILAVQGVTPPWLGSIVGAVCVAILSVLIGAPLLRLRGYYLACATFGLLLVVEISLAQLGSITGGHEGLMGIPPLTVFGLPSRQIFIIIIFPGVFAWHVCGFFIT